MINQVKKVLSFSFLAFVLLTVFSVANAQTCGGDPFCQKPKKQPKAPAPTNTTPTTNNGKGQGTGNGNNSSNGEAKPQPTPKPTPKSPVVVAAPPIEQRIAYYKQLRDIAIQTGQPLPKVTSVLTLDEMAVSGITKTSKGYAAMVEAKPLKLSYTIFPGEKFFDCQLVGVEENKLIFRKVIKMSNGKYIASTQEKTLREYTFMDDVQGTSPVGTNSGKPESASNSTPNGIEEVDSVKPNSQQIISPLEEMNNPSKSSNSIEAEKEKAKTKNSKGKPSQPAQKAKTKKPVKVAKNNK
jgi:hypothetical protein